MVDVDKEKLNTQPETRLYSVRLFSVEQGVGGYVRRCVQFIDRLALLANSDNNVVGADS